MLPRHLVRLSLSMFADDYDPNDVPADQARGYSYPVPETPLSLPLPVVEEYDDYDDYDPSDVPQDQAAPSAYLPPTNDEVRNSNVLIMILSKILKYFSCN